MKILNTLAIFLLLVSSGCSQPAVKQKSSVVPIFKMNNKMDESEFWQIIDYSAAMAAGDLKKQEQLIVQKLSAYQPSQIVEFEMILCRKLIEANDYKIMAADKIIDGSVTDDPYLYFRCWLIGLGGKIFRETIKNPDYLAGIAEKGVEPDFEGLLYVSTAAYRNKTGKKVEDDTFPRNVAFGKGLNYDLGGPAMTGNNWKEEDLPKLYPKLWNKFN